MFRRVLLKVLLAQLGEERLRLSSTVHISVSIIFKDKI
jgi:hypothetical protein